MVKYNIVHGKLQIDPETLTVQAFHAIWENDGSKTKAKASNMLTYIFTLCDESDKNPFKDIPYDKKEEVCKKNSFGDKNHKFSPADKKLIEAGIEWFKFLNQNSVQRLSISLDRKIDQLSTFLNNNDVKSAADFDMQSSMMVKVDRILKSKRETDKLMREELDKVRVKGNSTRSANSMGLLD